MKEARLKEIESKRRHDECECISDIDLLCRKIRRLKAALKKYGDHFDDCMFLSGDSMDLPCTCGFAKESE